MFKKISAAVVSTIIIIFTGCASSPDKVAHSYISPMQQPSVPATKLSSEYISSTVYKNHTCAELIEDRQGILSAQVDIGIKSLRELGTFGNQITYRELVTTRERLEARQAAIEKAAAKINCDLVVRKP